jgi:hypothetical protein
MSGLVIHRAIKLRTLLCLQFRLLVFQIWEKQPLECILASKFLLGFVISRPPNARSTLKTEYNMQGTSTKIVVASVHERLSASEKFYTRKIAGTESLEPAFVIRTGLPTVGDTCSEAYPAKKGHVLGNREGNDGS